MTNETKIVWKNVPSRDPKKAAIVQALRRAANAHATARVTLVEISKDGTRIRGRFPQATPTFTVDANGMVETDAPA